MLPIINRRLERSLFGKITITFNKLKRKIQILFAPLHDNKNLWQLLLDQFGESQALAAIIKDTLLG